ncbi:hypothetical protein BJ912DRAFT_1070154 [Pholiota molesta]|nr:hypothetical protein BJ912DRAFT_1070154 [Pholiota molesta]
MAEADSTSEAGSVPRVDDSAKRDVLARSHEQEREEVPHRSAQVRLPRPERAAARMCEFHWASGPPGRIKRRKITHDDSWKRPAPRVKDLLIRHQAILPLQEFGGWFDYKLWIDITQAWDHYDLYDETGTPIEFIL